MRYYCTFFSISHFTRGTAMYRSLKATGEAFQLYIFALDSAVLEILRNEALEFVTVIPVQELETDGALAADLSGAWSEDICAGTPFAILYCIEKFNLDQCTFLATDIWFFNSPESLFRELGTRSVLLTEFHYSPEYAGSGNGDKYCVQFITFNNDQRGMAALHWWRDRCVELRLKRQQTGKVSEQGYLSQMMNEFEGIHTLQHSGGGVAPWNVQQYEFFMEGNQILGTEYALRRDFELIFYHFHFLQIFSNGTVDLGRQNLSHQTMRLIYRPYINELENIENEMRVKYPDLNLQGIEPCKTTLKTIISSAYRKSRGVYNVFKIQEFLQGIIK